MSVWWADKSSLADAKIYIQFMHILLHNIYYSCDPREELSSHS